MRRTAEDTARTRSDLLRSALRTFASVGYHRTTLAGVAADAGVTRGAVYHHFRDKEDLYAAVLEHYWGRVGEQIWSDDPALLLAEWPAALRDDARFRELLTVTMDGPAGAEGLRRKAAALARWSELLRPAAARLAGRDGDPDDIRRHLLAWVVGTATLAALDPGLLPASLPPLPRSGDTTGDRAW